MTTRLNNSMIMVHLIRSLLTNLNSMTAIEAKYVELCKYTLAYVGLITYFYKEAQLSQRGRATQRRSDLDYVSTGDAWFDGFAVLLWARIGRIGAFGRSLPLHQNFAHTNHFGVVSQQAELSR